MLGNSEKIAVELVDKISYLSPFDQAVACWRTRFLQQARPKQVIPLEGGSWTHVFLCSGRGFGKTWTGSNWIGFGGGFQSRKPLWRHLSNKQRHTQNGI